MEYQDEKLDNIDVQQQADLKDSQVATKINESVSDDVKTSDDVMEEKEYIREDSEDGFTRSSTEIALLKASHKYEVIANRLLGNFDEDGHYVISTDILKELIELKKVVDKKADEGIFLKATYKDATPFIFFLSKPEVDDKNLATSTLYLHEKVEKVNGYIVDTITSTIGSYSYAFDDYYMDYCFGAFNIIEKKGDDDGKNLDDKKFLDARLKYLQAVRAASREKYVNLEENYFNKRLQILNEIPQGAIILSEFNKKRAQIDKYFLIADRNKFRALNELLTAILEANPIITMQMPAYKILMGTLNSKYLIGVKDISAEIAKDEEIQAAKKNQIMLVEGSGFTYAEALIPKSNKGAVKVGAPKAKAASKGGSRSFGGGGGKGGKGGGGKKGGGGGKKKNDEKKKPMGKLDNHQTTQPPKIEARETVEPELISQKKEAKKKEGLNKRKWNNADDMSPNL